MLAEQRKRHRGRLFTAHQVDLMHDGSRIERVEPKQEGVGTDRLHLPRLEMLRAEMLQVCRHDFLRTRLDGRRQDMPVARMIPCLCDDAGCRFVHRLGKGRFDGRPPAVRLRLGPFLRQLVGQRPMGFGEDFVGPDRSVKPRVFGQPEQQVAEALRDQDAGVEHDWPDRVDAHQS